GDGGGGTADGRRSLWVLALVTLALAGASAAQMALLYHPGFDPSRVYDGTDTRAFGLLFGAALAMVWPSRALSVRIAPRARVLLDAAGAAGLLGIGVLMWRTTQYSPFLYPDGMVLLSLATLAVVAAAAHPATWLGRALGWKPLRWVGSRSYAIYLWHYPIIVLTDPGASARPSALRDLAQVAASLVLAELSWRLVESPVRRAGRAGDSLDRLRVRPVTGIGRRPGLVLSAVAGVVVVGLAAVAALPGIASHPATSAAVGGSGPAPVTPTATTAPPA
ncbi:acyltransferase family protein, partial [Acidimicrobiaceae bacterium USS-CC1]|nr:acyltransferase family protein [Acidiferrimicrobium australe]